MFGAAEATHGRDHRCHRVASFAEDQIGGEEVLLLEQILARLAVDRDERLESLPKLVGDAGAIGRAQARANRRGIVGQLLKKRGASLEPRLIRLPGGDVRLL